MYHETHTHTHTTTRYGRKKREEFNKNEISNARNAQNEKLFQLFEDSIGWMLGWQKWRKKNQNKIEHE